MLTWHRHGYLHGDIKPANLRRKDDRHIVIIDADLAKRIADCSTAKPLGRHPDDVAGTRGFVDPRVASGELDWSVQAELFSVGKTLLKVQYSA